MTFNSNIPIHYAICTIGILALYLLPQLQLVFNVVHIAIITFVFFLVFIVPNGNWKNALNLIAWSMPLVLLMFFVAKPMDMKYGLVQNFMFMWVFVFPAILCNDVLSRNNRNWNYIVLVSSLALYSFVAIKTMLQYQEMPEIARAMTSGNTDEDFIESMKLLGVGGFGIAYCSGIISIALLILATKFQLYKSIKYASILLSVFTLYFAFTAKFTTLIIITCLSLLVMVYFGKQSTIIKTGIILSVAIALFFLPMIIHFFADINEGNSVGRNLTELYETTWGNSSEVSLREYYRQQSLKIFLSSPLWGNDVTGSLKFLHTHAHSTVCEYAISTGIIGLMSFFGTMYKSFKLNAIFVAANIYKAIYYPIITYYLLLSYYNPSNVTEICFALFLIVPLLYNSFDLKNK